MNEKTRTQIEEMKKQTIGVEVEMNNIERSRAAKVAAEFFGTGRYENTAYRNGYSTWSAWDSQGREWKFQKDVSISGPDSEKCELVTPILTYADMETLQELIRRLRRAGAKSDSTRGCGVHIHIGAKGHTPQTLRNLANIMASHESLLAEALNLDHYRMSRYCRTVDPASWNSSTAGSPAPWPTLPTFGMGARAPTMAEASITMTAATICSTSTPHSPRARSSSDFSNSMPLRTESATAFTPAS